MVAATASKPAEKPTTEMEVEKSPAEKEEEKRNLIVQDVKGQIKEIEKAVFAKEPRIISKVIYLSRIRPFYNLNFRFWDSCHVQDAK